MTEKLALETIRSMLENAIIFPTVCNDKSNQIKLHGIKIIT